MSIFQSLQNNANDSVSLDSYIQKNYVQIEAFCSACVDLQRKELDDFEQFVLFKTRVIEDLDYTKSHNRGFVYYLMDYCERFCSKSAVVQLYRIIQANKLSIGSRLEAAMLYLYNVPSNATFVDRFNDICSKLQIAINEEDDDDKKAIASFLNYYSYVVYNTSEQFSNEIVLKYTNSIENDSFPFLKNGIIKDCFELDFRKREELYAVVQEKIDEILCRNDVFITQANRVNDFLIESDTEYARILENTPKAFQCVRNISVQLFNHFDHKDDIFYSLGRGVKMLTEEAQLCSYINSYGNMHEAKMQSALQAFPLNELIGKDIEIFDWACGQGLASIIWEEFINTHNIKINSEKFVLIEPSEVALKRAALNVRHFNSQSQVETVLKDIDAVSNEDLNCDSNAIKVHLFSNILDIEKFSMEHLVSLIEQTQKGVCYFVCTSPYITDSKTARIDKFVQHFAGRYDSYHTYLEIEDQRGEWKNGWTRVIRLFSVTS